MNSSELLPGTLLGAEYVIQRKAGEGGMGTVYVAQQSTTQKLRALKVLPASVASDPKTRERFVREATVGGRIDSEHVVEVIAAGIDERLGGLPWIAMELLEGEDLYDHVGRHPGGFLPVEHAIAVLRQLFTAVMAAHRAGVVHRDLKPDNVYLKRSTLVGVPFIVKVLDFGISKIVTEAKSTKTGNMGTPGWLAPEQFKSFEVSKATDVWALGLLTFFTLTGRRFWLTEYDENAPANALLVEMLMSPIPKASERSAAFGCAQRLPPGLDAWMEGCLNREERGRFQDATAAWNALSAVLGQLKPNPTQFGEPSAQALQWAPAPMASQPELPRPPSASQTGDAHGTQRMAEPPPGAVSPAPLQAQAPTTHYDRNASATYQPAAAQPELSTGAPWSKGHTLPSGPTDLTDLLEPVPSRSGGRGAVLAAAAVGLVLLLAGGGASAWWWSQGAGQHDDVARSAAVEVAPIAAASSSAASVPAVPGSEMVKVAGGSVRVEGNLWEVPGFELDRYEATAGSYEACVTAGKCPEASSVNVAGASAWSVLCTYTKRTREPDLAMNCASWDDAVAYCAWRGARLPLEQEWYLAAFGPSGGPSPKYPWGPGEPRGGQVNLCDTSCAKGLRDSGLSTTKAPYPGGYADLHEAVAPVRAYLSDEARSGAVGLGGNVMEWTGTQEAGKAVARGGSWLSNQPQQVDQSGRELFLVGDRRAHLGIRCAR